MKPSKLISAIIGYLLVFQFLPLSEASCALSCTREEGIQQEISVEEPGNAGRMAEGLFTPPPNVRHSKVVNPKRFLIAFTGLSRLKAFFVVITDAAADRLL